jgi:hypothetical protein
MARLESGTGKHSPSPATLQNDAHALGCCLELRLVGAQNKSDNGKKITSGRTERSVHVSLNADHLDIDLVIWLESDDYGLEPMQ